MTPKQLAAQLRRDARDYERQYAKDSDSEIRKTIAKDVADLRTVADLIAGGDIKQAYRRAERLDTVVREAISRLVWNAMSGGASFGHTRYDR